MNLSQPLEVVEGEVWHTRVRPKPHKLRYRVFSLLLDVDRIDEAVASVRLLSRNRFNVLSIHDRDLGARDGRPVAQHARDTLQKAGYDPHDDGARIVLLTYPRMFGYVFNPLSVYFCHDRFGELRTLIYEVSNTYGERTSYVLHPGAPCGDTYAHTCRKVMDVSPFTEREDATYRFRLRRHGGDLTVGVQLIVAGAPVLKTHFIGRANGFSDRRILACLLRYPAMTFKVMAAIHFEALRLLLKRIPLVRRTPKTRFSIAAEPTAVRTRGNG